MVGGATSFLAPREDRKVDVDPKTGRVLIFQQRKLLHAGDDVAQGIKYTMRTEIMYELINPEDEAKGGSTDGGQKEPEQVARGAS